MNESIFIKSKTRSVIKSKRDNLLVSIDTVVLVLFESPLLITEKFYFPY